MSSNGVKPDEGQAAKRMGFFDSVLETPDWLNQSYIETVLRDYENDPELQVIEYSTSTCTKPGDNFVGVIFRAAVAYTTQGSEKKESLIIKIEPFLEGFKKDVMANQPFFTTEGRMYTEMLPVLQDLLRNSGDPEIIAPGLVHYSPNPKILIFKDIATDGFVMQHMPVNFEKAQMIARKLGKFHALSFFLNKENVAGADPSSFKDGFFSEKLIGNWDFIYSNMEALIDLTRDGAWGDEMRQVSKKLIDLKPHFAEKMKQIYTPDPKGVNFLNHGDFHIRNLLFRYMEDDSFKFDGIQFIDFQLSVYATPAIDLSYLLYLIADTESREHHRNHLLQTYHSQFTETLKALGYKDMEKAPSMIDIQMELVRNGLMEYCVATSFMTMYYMDLSKLADMDFNDMSKIAEMAKSMFEGEDLKRLMIRILPDMMYRGALDV